MAPDSQASDNRKSKQSKSHKRVGVYFFTNDLRLHDNPALAKATQHVDQLLCVFCYQPWWLQINRQQLVSLGEHRKRFLAETLSTLDQSLRELGQHLIVVDATPAKFLHEIREALTVHTVFSSDNAGYFEVQQWDNLKAEFDQIDFVSTSSATLFDQSQLPMSLSDLPETFTKFRKLVEASIEPHRPITTIEKLPPSPVSAIPKQQVAATVKQNATMTGGENAGLDHLDTYFSSALPSSYKEVRNAIDGWDNSTKFSPWLANGSLSVRTLAACLKQYETEIEQNSSTYWIYFELLWREYFHWHSRLHGKNLFQFQGVKSKRPLTTYYPERFKKWCSGNTPYPIVNACMLQLNKTGYLSNRGRQIVASCLLNELQVDWRYGAAYFEQQLIDYDVSSNWGNWQYLAGVGADARDKRHFNLDKQTELFDPDGAYREKSGATQNTQQLDSVDAADWPII